jgi:hypothetical protein
MGILSKWFGNSQPKTEQSEKVEKNEIWMKLSVSQRGNNVSINVHGLETVNVCLASFLTKGISYAQEKYNEYQANKDTDAIVEEPKAETKPRRERIASPTQRDIDEMRAWAKANQAKRESK